MYNLFLDVIITTLVVFAVQGVKEKRQPDDIKQQQAQSERKNMLAATRRNIFNPHSAPKAGAWTDRFNRPNNSHNSP